MAVTSINWKAANLNKGQSMSHEDGDVVLTVKHVDRVVDPYLAGVIVGGRVVYSGLHATLSGARLTCAYKAAIARQEK
jgi:hypothetical protein